MAYDEALARRVRAMLADERAEERPMFGGLTFMVHGKMCCGVLGDELVVRVGEAHEEALRQPHARPMDFTGRALKGFVYVAPGGLRTDPTLAAWVRRGVAAVEALAAGQAKQRARATPPRRRS